MIAQGDETLLHALPAHGVTVARRIEPPDARVAVLALPRILARQSRFADAAEAGDRCRLSNGGHLILA